jgi:hypothetical protein
MLRLLLLNFGGESATPLENSPVTCTAVFCVGEHFIRKSSTFVDAIHDLTEQAEMAPAQLYSTESGRLFHSGKIAIATVGLPARGKTYVFDALLAPNCEL